MKPKLILCPGMPRSGTTTLWSLLDSNNIIDGSLHKETHYLKMLCDMRDGNTDNIYPQYIKDMWINDLTIENKQLGFDLPYNFDDYKTYLYKNIVDESQCVADFSQTISILPAYFLKEVRNNLCNDFDIRIVILFRDPIKRLFSHCFSLREGGWIRLKNRWDNKIKSPREEFLDAINLPQFQNLYVDVKSKFEEIFDNVLFLSTEKFYTNQDDHDKLSNFLDVSRIGISNIHKNKTDYEVSITRGDIELATKKLFPSIEIHRQL